jgi:hypothetical protein
MCPFCFGAAAWAVAGVVSAGGLGVLAGVLRNERGSVAPGAGGSVPRDDRRADSPSRAALDESHDWSR